jgi:pimeloyl-ACP methyl ester carboxylesterase
VTPIGENVSLQDIIKTAYWDRLLTPILPQVTAPALVLVGEGSTMNTSERTRSLAELLPKGRLVEVPGASGYVQHAAPAQCVAIWRDFVKMVG